MDSTTVHELISAAKNRKEIIKASSEHAYAQRIPKDMLERIVRDVHEDAKTSAELEKSRLDLKIKILNQRKCLQDLLLQAKTNAANDRGKTNEKKNTAMRLIEKANFMRRLILILLANGSVSGTEYVLSVSQDLIGHKSLNSYQYK